LIDAGDLGRELDAARARIAALEAELAQARALSTPGRRARSVAHDIANLLAAIAGSSDLMLRALRADSPVRRRAEAVRIAAQSGQQLVRQLLSAEAPAAERPAAELNAVVAAVTRTLSPLLGDGITVELRLDPAVGVVAAPSAALEQVLMNLLLNARDAMPSGGRVVVATALRPEDESHRASATCSVEDTGIGMDEATLRRAFDPEFTTKPAGQGTGLGLWTVRELVHRYGGGVDVTSAPGQGSTFRVSWPIVDPAVTARSLLTARPAVIVVEDEPGVADVLVEILELHDHRVVRARDAEEALGACARDPHGVAVVVADLDTPGVAGPQFVAWLRDIAPQARLVYLSADAGEDTVGPFVPKPFAVDALLAKVQEAVAGRRPTGSDGGEESRGSPAGGRSR
jgi:hypothetical protein